MNIHLTLKEIFIPILIFSFHLCQAQVNLDFTTINEYTFSTKEAMNLIVTNGHTKSINVCFNGKIKDAAGNPVVEFKTHEAVLNTGANVFTPMNLSISEMQYANNDIAEIEATSGTYPSGNYTICIWATCVTQDCNGLGQNAISMEEPKCISVHIENPTPLILATPQNEAEIEEPRPLYSWIPPAPVAGSSNLNYTMILVEMLEGQSKADALTQNRPLIEVEGIGNPSLIHPSDLSELEKGKWYAWQVQAFVGKTSIGKSEQWKFKVKKEENKGSMAHLTLVKDQNVFSYQIKTSDSISLVFDQNYFIDTKEKWQLSIKDEFTGKMKELNFEQVEERYTGLKSIKILPFENFSAILNRYYLIELKGIKGETFFVRIQFSK